MHVPHPRRASLRATRAWRVGSRSLLACLLWLAIPGPPAGAQEIRLEVDQGALTRLLRRQVGARWALLRWRGEVQLAVERPRVEVTPLGLYLSGTLVSRSPELRVAVEVRFRPRLHGMEIRIDPSSVRLTKPGGFLGFLPKRILEAFVKSGAGRRALAGLTVDLGPLVAALGKRAVKRIRLARGFGRVSLVVTLR